MTTITTFQPLTDTSYIPCVSLLDFWLVDGKLQLAVYALSIDFGTKGYANLVELAALQTRVADDLGLGPLEGRPVGGGSDGNFTAGLGIPTLDGLGAVGNGAHSPNEFVVVDRLPQRAAVLAGLLMEL